MKAPEGLENINEKQHHKDQGSQQRGEEVGQAKVIKSHPNLLVVHCGCWASAVFLNASSCK